MDLKVVIEKKIIRSWIWSWYYGRVSEDVVGIVVDVVDRYIGGGVFSGDYGWV